MALDFAAGCLGGVAGVLVGHPFDTVKVHLQTQDFKNPKYRGTFHCLQSIVAKESIRGLYRGVSSPMGGVAFVNAIVFGVYGNVQRNMENPNSLYSHFMAGSIAGLTQSIVSSPMELAKTYLQLQTSNPNATQYKGPFQVMHSMWKQQGIRGVYRGLGITAVRDIPGFSSYFVSYELMVRNRNPSNFFILLAGGLAGSVSWIISIPFDIIKSRIQTDGMLGTRKYTSSFDCFQKSYREEGPRFLTRGLTSTLLRAFPMNAACFFVVSYVLKFFDKTQISVEVHNPEPLHVVGLAVAPVITPHVKRHCDFTRYKLKNQTIRGLVFLGAFNEAVCASEIVEMHDDDEIEHYHQMDLDLAENFIKFNNESSKSIQNI